MFGIASVIAFILSYIFWIAGLHKGEFLSWQGMMILGLTCLAIHIVLGWLPVSFTRRS